MATNKAVRQNPTVESAAKRFTPQLRYPNWPAFKRLAVGSTRSLIFNPPVLFVDRI